MKFSWGLAVPNAERRFLVWHCLALGG